jgi:hypothetical protein
VLVHRILVGVTPLLDFDDDGKLRRALIGNRYRPAAASGDLLDCRNPRSRPFVNDSVDLLGVSPSYLDDTVRRLRASQRYKRTQT